MYTYYWLDHFLRIFFFLILESPEVLELSKEIKEKLKEVDALGNIIWSLWLKFTVLQKLVSFSFRWFVVLWSLMSFHIIVFTYLS